MFSIVPLATNRVSDLLVRTRLLRQIQFDQADLLRIQEQISTGRRVLTPSEDAPAAVRAMALQRLLERKEQVRLNLNTNQSYLSATDTALSSVSGTLADIRAQALGVVGTTSTDTQRQAIVASVDRTVQQLVEIGNRQFRGRYLFAGSNTTEKPFATQDRTVAYHGNEGSLRSYSDLDLLFESNVPGNAVFGGLSSVVQGSVDLDPLLTADTKLRDLRGGEGVGPGSFAISDGFDTQIIDISGAETIGDVARLIEAHPPAGRVVTAEVTATGLELRLEGGGPLVIQEVAGGVTALELGLLEETGADPLVGDDLNPRITLTTPLADLFGRRARAEVVSTGANNDFVLEASTRGDDLNGIDVVFAAGGIAGAETASLVGTTLTITIQDGVSTAAQVVAAVNGAVGLPFTARLGAHDAGNDGSGAVELAAVGLTSGGAGLEFDQTSGLRVENGGQTQVIGFASAETVEDLLNTLNGAGAGLLAQINAAGDGIDLRSRLAGADFSIGENGGQTAAQLGLRTFTRETRLADLNYGRGVRDAEGTDFTITRTDGVTLDIDLAGAETVGDVLDRINAASLAAAGTDNLTAQLAVTGNGIELVSDNPSPSDPLVVQRTLLGPGAIDLGLIPEGQEISDPAVVSGTTATLTGRDVNPQEAHGVFNALLRMRDALVANDQFHIQRSLELLDEANVQLNFTRGEVAARQQSLDLVQERLDEEKIELTAVLSEEIDVDLAAAVSELSAKQASFEAALQMASRALQLSLLDFL